MGQNGAGKTTLCQCFNGTVPNFHEGKLKGKVEVLGHCTTDCAVSDLADKIGMVLEDPEAQLFTTTVRNEVAFGAENLQVDPDEIIRRINWALDIVGLSEYIDREPTALSGGQKQRLAIATNLVMLPSVLVLDEPTLPARPRRNARRFQRHPRTERKRRYDHHHRDPQKRGNRGVCNQGSGIKRRKRRRIRRTGRSL